MGIDSLSVFSDSSCPDMLQGLSSLYVIFLQKNYFQKSTSVILLPAYESRAMISYSFSLTESPIRVFIFSWEQ